MASVAIQANWGIAISAFEHTHVRAIRHLIEVFAVTLSAGFVDIQLNCALIRIICNIEHGGVFAHSAEDLCMACLTGLLLGNLVRIFILNIMAGAAALDMVRTLMLLGVIIKRHRLAIGKAPNHIWV